VEVFAGLAQGFSVILTAENLHYVFLGSLIGTLIGVLPGIGPLAAMSLLLPATFALPPVAMIAMLTAMFYGAMYGGTITSVLVNIPGEAASVITCLDGHAMARQGRAGAALGIAALGSFIAGTLGLVVLSFFAPLIAEYAVRLGPPEYAALMALGLACTVLMVQGPPAKGLAMIALGSLLASVGMDMVTGEERFTFGTIQMTAGFELVAVIIGLFGIAEILSNVEERARAMPVVGRLSQLWPSREDWRAAAAPILRGSGLGFVIGLLPGGGPVTASFVSYVAEQRAARDKRGFGQGRIEGVAGPESANNAAVASGMIPLLSLGLPGNAVTALLLGALVIAGVQPGPLMITQHADVFWGVIASMYVGNVMLLILNLPLVGLWVQLLRVPYAVLFPAIVLLAIIGTWSANRNLFDLWVMLGFGVLGWLLRKLGYELAPFVLAFVLAPLLEQAVRQSLLMSPDGAMIFVERPVSAVLLGACALLCLFIAARRRPLVPGGTT
jgi:putative tricarboxylic transport membrane protein